MSEIIRKIFRGDANLIEQPFSPSSRESKAFCQMEELTEKMQCEFPKEFHPLLRQYQDSMMKLLDSACEEDFLCGYRLGVQMMLAAWPNRQKQT